MKIIQVTDTHLGARDEHIAGLSPIQRLAACVADIEAHHADAAFCVFSGDLTDAGKPQAYQALSEILSTLTPPVVLMMGNHDHRERLCAVFPQIKRDENGFVQWRLKSNAGNFLFLDTVDQGSHEGLYCELRRRWLVERLAEAGDNAVYIFVHHPPFDVGIPGLDLIGLREHQAFADILAAHGNIAHLFFGHVHRPVSGSWHGIPFSSLRGTNHSVALDFSDPGYLPRCYEPPNYAVILIEDGKVLVHLHDFLDETKMIQDDAGHWVFAKNGERVSTSES